MVPYSVFLFCDKYPDKKKKKKLKKKVCSGWQCEGTVHQSGGVRRKKLEAASHPHLPSGTDSRCHIHHQEQTEDTTSAIRSRQQTPHPPSGTDSRHHICHQEQTAGTTSTIRSRQEAPHPLSGTAHIKSMIISRQQAPHTPLKETGV